MMLVRWLSIPTGLCNISLMILARHTQDVGAFFIGWIGACFAFYALLYYVEETDMASAGYRDLAVRLRYNILEEGWQPGTRLPAVRRIAEQYGVTRTTAVRAIKVLEAEGVIQSVAGRGTYVTGDPGDRDDKPRDKIERHLKLTLNKVQPGAPMPDTKSLSELFSVHPITVRRVQADLVERGLLRRSRSGNYFKA